MHFNSVVLGALLLLASMPSWPVSPEEITKFTIDGTAFPGSRFGWWVDVDADTAVVGAPRLSLSSDNTDYQRGATYIYIRSGDAWSLQQMLVASDGACNDRFGYRVAVSGDTVIVSARYDDDLGNNSGSAYVYTRSGAVWSLQQKLTASDGAVNDQFGLSVQLAGDRAFVGTGRDSYDIDGDLIEEIGAGSVYLFERSGGNWTESTKLHPDDATAGQNFGGNIAVSGDTLAISANNDNEVAAGAGAGYVFTRSGSSWNQQAKLTATDGLAGDSLGGSVAISGDTVILGAMNGIAGQITGNKAYVFVRDSSTWTQQARLTPSSGNLDFGDFFGTSALFGDIAVIGADADDEMGESSGAAYVFTRSDGVWTESAKIFASDAQPNEWFGARLAMDGDTVLITAPTSAFVNGIGSGSAYVFDLNSGETTTGSDVVVEPVAVDSNGDPVENAPELSLAFDSVTGDGETTVTVTDDGPPPPDGFKVAGLSGTTYLEIDTTATFDGLVEICIDYSDIPITGNPQRLNFSHYEDGSWVDITSSNDTVNMILCGLTSSFSFFAIFEDDSLLLLAELVDAVHALGAKKSVIGSLSSILKSVRKKLEDDNPNNDMAAADKLLNDFVDAVESRRGKHISDADADALISSALAIATIVLF